MRWILAVRFGLRQMMFAIVLVALGMACCRLLCGLWYAINDTHYFSCKEYVRSWDAGCSPEVVIDSFTGRIDVVQATDSRVKARLRLFAATKESQAAADRAVAAIILDMTHEGGNVRISARRPANLSKYRSNADVVLHVPPGACLDLHTACGDISVGRAHVGTTLVRSPPAVRSLKARADFDGEDWSYHGDIFVETATMCARGSAPCTTDLQLEAVRKIDVYADNAGVQARARGGTYLVSHDTAAGTVGAEEIVEGSIDFVGTLSEGHHSFWAADRTVLRLPPNASYDLNAQVNGGAITTGFPVKAGGGIQSARLHQVVGTAPRTFVRLRVDRGSISVQQQR